MTPESAVDEVVEAYLAHLETGSPAPDIAVLEPELRAEAEVRIALIDAAAGVLVAVPEPNESRAAAALGFNRRGEEVVVSGEALRRRRSRLHRKVGEVVSAVQGIGADLTSATLLRLETAPATPLPQPLVTALAVVLDCDVRDLEATSDVQVSALRAFLDSRRASDAIAAWAAAHGRDHREVAGQVRRQLTGANFRAEQVSEDQFFELLSAILRRLER